MSGLPVEIKLETPDVSEWKGVARGALSPAEFKKALARGVNDALAKARTRILKKVTSRYTVERKDITKFVKLYKPSNNDPTGRIIFKSTRLSLGKFKLIPVPSLQKGIPVARRKRVTVEKVKGRSYESKRGFAAEMKSGHKGLFHRTGNKDKKPVGKHYKRGKLSDNDPKNKTREQIKERTGPSIAHMVGSMEIIEPVQTAAEAYMKKRIDHHMMRALKS